MLIMSLLLAGSTFVGQLPNCNGTISGQVVNRSSATPVPCQTTVVLRVEAEGQLVPLREERTDTEGRFRFERLPVGADCQYVAGANRDGIHYPGPRVSLTEFKPHAVVELAVHDAVAQPNPLLIRQCEIVIRPEPGALHVTETMVIDNPSSTCYVGQPPAEGAEPVTLKLAIPADFERTTFQEEFYGRRFFVMNDAVATGIPWPPGTRKLKFTYVLRNAQSQRAWLRPLDLPCVDLRVRVETLRGDEVACELPKAATDVPGEVVFCSQGQRLPAGYMLRVELGRLPVSWMASARWLAAGGLVVLVAVVGIMTLRRGRRPASASLLAGSPPAAEDATKLAAPHDKTARRRSGQSAG